MSDETWTCPEHGVTYGSDIGPRSFSCSCPECDRLASREEQRLDLRHQRYRWWKEWSGVPLRYRAATPQSIQAGSPSAKTLARAVGAYTGDLRQQYESGQGLLLIGPPGLGKTLALAATINAACQIYRGPTYAVWPDVLAEVKAGFNGPKDDERRQAVERLREAPFLALDELGVRGMTDFDHSELFGLVDYRYRETLPTLVAANATPANFASMVGERVADRLREMSAQIVLSGESLRGKTSIAGADAFEQPQEAIVVRTHLRGEWRERTIRMERGRLRA